MKQEADPKQLKDKIRSKMEIRISQSKPVNVKQKTLVTCTVCYEIVEQNDIIEFDGASHDICNSCFVEYLTTQINNNKVLSNE